MTRKELTKRTREFFRKRREYMSSRIDTACHNHFSDTRVDSLEAEHTVLEFVERSTEFIDMIRTKAQIDVEDDETARAFVKERVPPVSCLCMSVGPIVHQEAARRLEAVQEHVVEQVIQQLELDLQSPRAFNF